MSPVPDLGAMTVGFAAMAVTGHQGSGPKIAEFEQGLQQLLATSLKLALRGTVYAQSLTFSGLNLKFQN